MGSTGKTPNVYGIPATLNWCVAAIAQIKGQLWGLATNPLSNITYKGTWIPDTNTPTLADGTGTLGDFYLVAEDGSYDWGGTHGTVDYLAGNALVYDGTIWQKVGNITSSVVSSVTTEGTNLIIEPTTGDVLIEVLSAPKLETSRRINNVSFDGTSNILLNSSITTIPADYTLLDTDNQTKVIMTASSGTQLVTVPNGLPQGAQIDVIRMGAAAVTFVAGSGATIRSAGGLRSITNQYNAVTLVNVGSEGSNDWVLIGALS
jgi:hypothetical protein